MKVIIILIVSSIYVIASAWNVHEDLLAHPQYTIDVKDELVPNSTAESILSRGNDDEQQTVDKILPLFMRSASGQPYLCYIPRVVDRTDDKEAKDSSNVVMRKKETDIAFRGLQLLEGMRGHCLYLVQEWWTYKFCYGSEIKQFHAFGPVNGVMNWPPTEDPNTFQFILGKFDNRLLTIDEDSNSDGNNQNKASIQHKTRVQTSAERSYLVQIWTDGTKCDVTGEPRTIEIEYHCSVHRPDEITSIKEMSICNYKLVVQTPKLCSDVAFMPPQKSGSEDIGCQTIVSDDYYKEREADRKRAEIEMLAAMKEHSIEGPEKSTKLIDNPGDTKVKSGEKEKATAEGEATMTRKVRVNNNEKYEQLNEKKSDLTEISSQLTKMLREQIDILQSAMKKKNEKDTDKEENPSILSMLLQMSEDGNWRFTDINDDTAMNERIEELLFRIAEQQRGNGGANFKSGGQDSGTSSERAPSGSPVSNPKGGLSKKSRPQSNLGGEQQQQQSPLARDRVYAVNQHKMNTRLSRNVEESKEEKKRKDEL